MDKKLTKSLEIYLLAIDELQDKKKKIKVKDVANFLGYGGASTSQAVKKLKENKLINYEPYSDISLTPKGKELVSMKKYRHNTIAKFLNKVLDIDVKSAKKNADFIEYSMTEDVLTRLVNFMDFMEQCACGEKKWITSCKNSLGTRKLPMTCQNCKFKSLDCGCGMCTKNC